MKPKVFEVIYKFTVAPIVPFPSAVNLNAEPNGVLVRCKDCKHRDPKDKKCDCGHSILWQLPRSDEWFCADAERRGEE